MTLRNWIERATKKQLMHMQPVCVGCRGGRKVYSLTFTDGTEQEYYIDFEAQTIEEI